MGIDVVSRLGGGQATRPPGSEQGAARGNPRNTTAPSTLPDLVEAHQAAAATGATPAERPHPTDEASLMKAVEEANSLAGAAFSQRDRSVSFSRDEDSGRLVMTIRDKENGEETTRQLPPEAFLQMLERLREARGEGDSRSPSLVELDA